MSEVESTWFGPDGDRSNSTLYPVVERPCRLVGISNLNQGFNEGMGGVNKSVFLHNGDDGSDVTYLWGLATFFTGACAIYFDSVYLRFPDGIWISSLQDDPIQLAMFSFYYE